MKSNVYKLPQGSSEQGQFSCLLDEVSNVAELNKLDKKQANRLRLLAEELICVLPVLLKFNDGEFWIENNGKNFELHTVIKPSDIMTWDKREKILEISTSGKNEAVKGIMNKILLTVQLMMLDSASISNVATQSVYNFYDMGRANIPIYAEPLWTLNSYRQAGKENDEAVDELEKSIIANIADDVIVGIKSMSVSIIVKKSF